MKLMFEVLLGGLCDPSAGFAVSLEEGDGRVSDLRLPGLRLRRRTPIGKRSAHHLVGNVGAQNAVAFGWGVVFDRKSRVESHVTVLMFIRSNRQRSC